jgi:AcrR family transcriptional regulator
MTRSYRLGRRQASIDATSDRILAAARRLLETGPGGALSVGKVAREAGVTRATVYNRFGSRAGLIRALTPAAVSAQPADGDPRETLRQFLSASCARWAASPILFRHLPAIAAVDQETPRRLAETLGAADALRPGCSLKEAEDVVATLGSFAVFDRLHHDGRRAPGAVAEILLRLAGGILA